MININDQTLVEDVMVFAHADKRKFNTFYLVPQNPRYQLNENGQPVFQLLKYRTQIDRPDGRIGGGFLTFGVELSVPEETESAILAELQERVDKEAKRRRIDPAPKVEIASLPLIDGSVDIAFLSNSDVIMERVYSPYPPSLFGNNNAIFAAELTPEGATIAEQALQGGVGGSIVVRYKLIFDAKLPPLKVSASWRASQFYSFIQDIDVTERICREDDYRETLSEYIRKSQSTNFVVDPGSSQIDNDIILEVEEWARRSMDTAIENLMIKELKMEDPAEARKWYKENDIEDVRKQVTKSQVSNYAFNYTRETIVPWDLYPQRALDNITELPNVKWEDHFMEIDLDDEFFRKLNVAVSVNAPFNSLPINSIEVKLNYNGRPMNILGSNVDGEFRFTSPNETAYFAAYVENDNWKYTYSYQINYEGSSEVFQSREISTDESQLTINVDDVGIVSVDIAPGDINFDQIKQALVTMRYTDRSRNVDMIEQQFIIDPSNPYHRFQEVIMVRRSVPYSYKVKYFMHDGKEYEIDWEQSESSRLYINDVFNGKKTVNLRGLGFQDDVQTIFIDLVYREERNDYEQRKSLTLTSRQQFSDWSFPLVDAKVGELKYTGTIIYRDGSSKSIPETTAQSDTITVGEIVQDILEINVNAFLLDFIDTLRMAVVKLRYDDGNGTRERKTITFTANRGLESEWVLKIKDREKSSYTWEAVYYLQDRTKVVDGPHKTYDLDLILEMPA